MGQFWVPDVNTYKVPSMRARGGGKDPFDGDNNHILGKVGIHLFDVKGETHDL